METDPVALSPSALHRVGLYGVEKCTRTGGAYGALRSTHFGGTMNDLIVRTFPDRIPAAG
jgi:hypothetical protein